MSNEEISLPPAPGKNAGELSYGCLFCRSGKEERVARDFERLYPDVRAVAPAKLRYRRTGGRAVEERVALLPGYVFFRARELGSLRKLFAHEDVYRLLTYEDREWRLHGGDAEIADAFFRQNGLVGLSRAWYEGDRIRIADGFLKDYEGAVTRVNHRAKTAEVRVRFQEKTVTMWLGFELITPEGTADR